MMRVAIIGGKLQGLETAYLALKAGMETVVIDKNVDAIAKNICHEFVCLDLLKKEQKLLEELKKADLIIPALENNEVLNALHDIAEEYELIVAFDWKSYHISSSKILSDKMMQDHNINTPKYYPCCDAPYIAKPSSESGSSGVQYFETAEALEDFIRDVSDKEKWVIQEYLSGRSYSLEVIGMPGNYRTYQVTEIIVDEGYDCKRVCAPCDISQTIKRQFINISSKIANILKLKGIMDVEIIIDDHGGIKILEIDARFPSQTPTVVYHSLGINLVEELGDVFINSSFKKLELKDKKHVSYEHLLIEDGKIKVLGEHIMANAGPLNHMFNFCGSNEVLTNYEAGTKSWKGTFINIADTKTELEQKRKNMFEEIRLIQGEELELYDLGRGFK